MPWKETTTMEHLSVNGELESLASQHYVKALRFQAP